MNYNSAVSMVRGKRNANRRKVGNNTYAEILNDTTVAIKLHNTYVVKIHADGTYTLNSGGWQTATTKDRINQYSPVRVYEDSNYSSITGKYQRRWFVTINNKPYPFIDGMVVS